MKKGKLLVISVALATLIMAISVGIAAAEEMATPEEVIAKVKEAADFLSKNGEAGLAQFNDPKGPWVYKDTYVFVTDCSKDVMVGHPMSGVLGAKLSGIMDKKDGTYPVGTNLCEAAKKPDGGWVEYYWTKLGSDAPVRKISYMLTVPGQPYEVGAGIYDEEKSLDELNAMIK
jgi:hypothetical protein